MRVVTKIKDDPEIQMPPKTIFPAKENTREKETGRATEDPRVLRE